MFVAILVFAIIEAIIIAAILLRRKENYDGSMIVTDSETKKTFSLEIDVDPDELEQKKQIVLKVKSYSEE